MSQPNFRILFSVGLGLELVLTAVSPTPIQAQFAPGTSQRPLSSPLVVGVTFDPPGDGKPDDTAGGASRDGGICPQDANALSPSMTPLKPTSYESLTVAERPTFFIYVPQTAAQKAVFVLKDEKEDYYYQKVLPIPRTAGILSFSLPHDAPTLAVGKTYQWSFIMVCGEAIRPDSPGVKGRIRRIEPTPALINQLKQLSPLERAALYGKNGLWYDTVASLAEQRRSHPNDLTLTTTWEKLLKSVGLEVIATKPLLP